MSDTYPSLLAQLRDIGKLDAIDALLEWDQDTYMPSKGVNVRAETSAFVAALRHERWTSNAMADAIAHAKTNSDPIRETNLREAQRTHERALRIPSRLVEAIARTSAKAKDAWAAARRASDFARFAPHLSELVALKREEAEAIGYDDDPYDALMDTYEPGASTRQVSAVFAELRDRLAPLVQELANAPQQPDFGITKRCCPQSGQARLCREVAGELGFDFDAGRLDVSVHPFCTSIGSGEDVRITTRYDEHYFPAAVFGVMHEVGHGLYEQGLDREHAFTPMGRYCSLGIHESQSRLWENLVGRSRAFWETRYQRFRPILGDAFEDVPLDAFYGAINTVAPSLIRVEADEVTYNLHIIVRFELERDILNQRLDVTDIPAAWNAKMADLVGVTPTNDAAGCLQDIHWSMGAFGYFPTYALGNLYAAQFFAAARRDLGDLDACIRDGRLHVLLEWLRTHVHRHGMRYRADELCRQATGASLSVDPFMDYVNAKYRPIYGLA